MERRPISDNEVQVIHATLERAPARPVVDSAVDSIPSLVVVGRCECGCATVDFDAPQTDEQPAPIADGVGETPRGGVVGIIVWGRSDAITGLEIYDLGAGDDDLVLPKVESITSWERRAG